MVDETLKLLSDPNEVIHPPEKKIACGESDVIFWFSRIDV